MPDKTCLTCEMTKDKIEFYKHRAICKSCMKKKREIDKDKIKEYKRAYRQKNKDKIKEYKRAYRQKKSKQSGAFNK